MKKESVQKRLKKNFIGILIAATFMLILTSDLCAGPIILKFGTIEPPNAFTVTQIFKPFFERVEKDAEGTIKIQLYTAGTLGRNPYKYLKGVQDGVMDMGFIINAYYPGRFPDDEIANAPFMAENPMDGSIAINQMVEKGIMRGYERVIPLGVFCLNQYLIHSTFPVKTPEDLKGKKFGIAGRMQHAIFKGIGGTPVDIPVQKNAESISRGVISGCILEWNGMQTFKIFDTAPYHTVVSFGATILSIVMNEKSYNKLPAKAKAAFDKHKGEPFARSFGEKQTENENQIMQRISQDTKHHVYIPNEEEMKKWKAKMLPLLEEWKNEHPKGEELLNAYQTELERARAH